MPILLACKPVVWHSFYQNYGHAAFHVRAVPLRGDDLQRVHAYMSAVLQRLGVRYVVVGGIENHVHLLGDFPVSKAVSVIVRDVKVATSMWLKQCRAEYARFGCQGGFGYRSVSADLYLQVKGYILHQRRHHEKKDF